MLAIPLRKLPPPKSTQGIRNGAWESCEIPNADLGAISRQQPKLSALRHGESRQFTLLPLDGAKVSVWDYIVFPRPMATAKAAQKAPPSQLNRTSSNLGYP